MDWDRWKSFESWNREGGNGLYDQTYNQETSENEDGDEDEDKDEDEGMMKGTVDQILHWWDDRIWDDNSKSNCQLRTRRQREIESERE
jgi:hypothetical protein